MRSGPLALKLTWTLHPRLESHTQDVPRGEDSLQRLNHNDLSRAGEKIEDFL